MKATPADVIRSEFGENIQIRYMPNGGNLGDALIAAATIQYLDREGFKWDFVERDPSDLTEKLLIYGGGGSLIDLYDGGYHCIQHLHGRGKKVLILPHTIRERREFWENIPETYVFCRDLKSYEFMQSIGHHKVFRANDMATTLDISTSPYGQIRSFREQMRKIGKLSPGLVQALRLDEESGGGSEKSEIDFSSLGHPLMNTRENIIGSAVFFLTMIAGFESVYTDRLHVAVSCGLLGINCKVRENSYGKIAAVFSDSIREMFPSVTFSSDMVA